VSGFSTSEASLARHFHATARQHGFPGPHGASRWQTDARSRLRALLGVTALDATPPPTVTHTGATRLPGEPFTREHWRVAVEPDNVMPVTALIPDGVSGPVPAVICAHGHASCGRAFPSGDRTDPRVAASIDAHNGAYGVAFARAGCIAVCPDARGFGDRREPAHQRDDAVLGSSCHQLSLASVGLGLSVIGLWAFDLIRLLDILQADPRIAPDRIGAAGLSGGGWQTLALGALDLRVCAAVVSGYFYGVRESLQVQNGNCDCNMAPHLWTAFDMGDIGALFAGRALWIETGDTDPLNGASGVDNVLPQVAIARAAFDALGGTLVHEIFPGGHRWHGESSVPWLVARLKETP
jgi:hypothetical protein